MLAVMLFALSIKGLNHSFTEHPLGDQKWKDVLQIADKRHTNDRLEDGQNRRNR